MTGIRDQDSGFVIQGMSGYAALDEFMTRGEAAQSPLTPES